LGLLQPAEQLPDLKGKMDHGIYAMVARRSLPVIG
jgi:hypothetical protein